MKPQIKNIGLGTPPEEVSLDDHLTIVATVKAEAEALPAEAVNEPTIPMPVYISECTAMVVGAKEYFQELSDVGYTTQMLQQAEARLLATISAQAVWNTERRGGHSEAIVELIANAEKLRSDLVAAAVLALRKDREGKRRLDQIREGDSIPDLITDLGDLAVLLTDCRAQFEAIKLDVDGQAKEAAQLRDQLRGALAQENVAKSLSGSKEMRDRVYTLCKESIDELRDFATFVFRNDRTDSRRRLFSSTYLRRRNRRARQQTQSEQSAASASIGAE